MVAAVGSGAAGQRRRPGGNLASAAPSDAGAITTCVQRSAACHTAITRTALPSPSPHTHPKVQGDGDVKLAPPNLCQLVRRHLNVALGVGERLVQPKRDLQRSRAQRQAGSRVSRPAEAVLRRPAAAAPFLARATGPRPWGCACTLSTCGSGTRWPAGVQRRPRKQGIGCEPRRATTWQRRRRRSCCWRAPGGPAAGPAGFAALSTCLLAQVEGAGARHDGNGDGLALEAPLPALSQDVLLIWIVPCRCHAAGPLPEAGRRLPPAVAWPSSNGGASGAVLASDGCDLESWNRAQGPWAHNCLLAVPAACLQRLDTCMLVCSNCGHQRRSPCIPALPAPACSPSALAHPF